MENIDVSQYISKMYKDGFNGIITKEGVHHTGYCPFCGSTHWDYTDGIHEGSEESSVYDCDECGAQWIEEWTLKQVRRMR